MSDQEFQALLGAIDRDLADQQVPISGRPLRAMLEYSKRTNTAFIMTGPLGERISAWFRHKYGCVLDRDFRIGNTVVELLGDLWRVRLPVIFGTWAFGASRKPMATRPSTNTLDLVESEHGEAFPDGARASLADVDLNRVDAAFRRAYLAMREMPSSNARGGKHEMVSSARADLETAVVRMIARPQHWGQSRWASLQAVEKLLKVAIEAKAGTFDKTHDLARLSATAVELGGAAPSASVIARIQCQTGVRYDMPVTRSEAVDAHYASLEAVHALFDGN